MAVTPLEEWLNTWNWLHSPRYNSSRSGKHAGTYLLQYVKEERHAYDEHLSAIMIQNDVLDGAKLEGRMEGRMEGVWKDMRRMEERLEIASNLKSQSRHNSYPKATGLSLKKFKSYK